ncbi:MAG: hypothetical protein ACTHKV_01690, partial [Flavipsychrobacter sp.]
MKIVFWNTKHNASIPILLDVLIQEMPDVLFLAEIKNDTIKNGAVELLGAGYKHVENPGCNRISIIAKKATELVLGKQSYYYSTLKDNTNKVSIIAVHLPSELYNHQDGLKKHLRSFREEIDSEFGMSSSENIIIIGDFN